MNFMTFNLFIVFVKKRKRTELLDGILLVCVMWMKGISYTDPTRKFLALRTAVHTLDNGPPGTGREVMSNEGQLLESCQDISFPARFSFSVWAPT